eukprot:gnl/MRDRNA2_/MRDRNA2_14588_c0_seq2.p2 gnl/MRDRNA2_/MRDRNA2_14588_c0~~gnl/MRDRNA2_/MRDRNA2_14588_c0_seq2.p2  ORF type:complete len:158 (+),score=29.80 gnl/MRDRNA2_/MRDRNA2_14588_c0_seq2:497-970(+)
MLNHKSVFNSAMAGANPPPVVLTKRKILCASGPRKRIAVKPRHAAQDEKTSSYRTHSNSRMVSAPTAPSGAGVDKPMTSMADKAHVSNAERLRLWMVLGSFLSASVYPSNFQRYREATKKNDITNDPKTAAKGESWSNRAIAVPHLLSSLYHCVCTA